MNKKECPIVHSTPTDAHYFFGFHDVCPWGVDNERLAMLRVEDPPSGIPSGEEEASICIWSPKSKCVEQIGKTTAWNWQQGARLQWLDRSRPAIIYNDTIDGHVYAVEKNLSSGDEDRYEGGIYSISPDAKKALTVSFGRLGKHWSSYGYSATAPELNRAAPKNDGVFITDLENDTKRLVWSLEDVSEVCGLTNSRPKFISHPTFSPSGKRFCFFLRYIHSDGGIYSVLLVSDIDGESVKIVEEGKVSHFDWLDDSRLLLWARFGTNSISKARSSFISDSTFFRYAINAVRWALGPSIKSKISGEHYAIIDVEKNEKVESVGKDVLDRDGHPMWNPKRRDIFVTDTYPDKEDMQNLILYSTSHQKAFLIKRLDTCDNLNLGTKCDLHPRWDRSGSLVCIDSFHEETRGAYIVDSRPALRALGSLGISESTQG